MRIANIAIVNPIATTPDLTIGTLLRPSANIVPLRSTDLRELNIVELGQALADKGHATTVLLGRDYLNGETRELTRRLKVEPIPTVMHIPFHPGIVPFAPSLAHHPALKEADVIQTGEFHQPSTYFACKSASRDRKPAIVWQETYGDMRPPGSAYQRAFELTAGKFVRTTATRYVPRTRKASEYLTDLGVARNRIAEWIPTGINLDIYRPQRSASNPPTLRWKGEVKILLIVARMHRSKGLDLALKAFRLILQRDPDARLVIRGSGPERENLRRLAVDLHIQDSVQFLERVPRDQMVQLYNAASLVLNTSRNDLLPFTLLEAGACGRPSVARDVGAVSDIVRDGETGVIVRGEGVEEVAGAVASLLADTERQTAMGAEARKRMESLFSLPKVADRLLQVFDAART